MYVCQLRFAMLRFGRVAHVISNSPLQPFGERRIEGFVLQRNAAPHDFVGH